MTIAPRDPWTAHGPDRSPSSTPLDGPLPPSLDPLGELLPGWGVAAPLSPEATLGLWALCMLDLAFGGWLLLVRFGSAPCSGLLCTVVTLGDQPVLTLLLAEGGAVTLGVLLPVRGGLSRVHGPRTGLLVVAAVCGAIALSGAAVLLLGVALVFLVVVGALVALAG